MYPMSLSTECGAPFTTFTLRLWWNSRWPLYLYCTQQNITACVSLEYDLNLTEQKYNVNVSIHKINNKIICMISDVDGLWRTWRARKHVLLKPHGFRAKLI